jgi:diguanylate cyclase (GGDEF)-like protein
LSLQRRLAFYFIVIVILPLAAAGIVMQRIVVHEIGARAERILGPVLDAPSVLYNERVAALDDRARAGVGGKRLAVLIDSKRAEGIDSYLQSALDESSEIDFLVLVTDDGRTLGEAIRPGEFVDGYVPPTTTDIVDGDTTGLARTEIPIEIGKRASSSRLIVGFWLDRNLLVGSQEDEVELSLVVSDQVVASTIDLDGPQPVDVSLGERFEMNLGGDVIAEARAIDDNMAFLATASREPAVTLSTRVWSSIAALLILALVGTAALAFLLARLITRPLEELAAAASAIAEGQFDRSIPVRSRDEVGRLASAFNEMTGKLQSTIGDLSASRDQLQLAVRRVGEILRSTHDMTQIRRLIVDTAADATQADAAVLWTFTPTREELIPAETRGLKFEKPPRVKVGTGAVGAVADDAVTVVLPSDDILITPAPAEPDYPILIATPVFTQDRVTGVLVNYRRENPFSDRDLETVRFLAEQGGAAIENVMLHEDTRRLSLTDGLTGVYNRRYLQMQARQTFATATRFGRQFSVLMIDLDRFKVINDTYGHQRGDAVLVEFARRVSATLREVDTFARYGGEEFVCLLSETGLHGAMATAQKIIESIRSRPFGGPDEDEIQMTVSVGVGTFPDHGNSFITVLEAADRALYRAKQEGRDRYSHAGQVATTSVPGGPLN